MTNNQNSYLYDNVYLPSWNKFDYYGVVIKSMSKFPSNNYNFNLCSLNIGDETAITNTGVVVGYFGNQFIAYAGLIYTITPVPDPTQRRITMGSLYSNNAQVYYKSHTLAPGGIGGVRNYRLKSRKT
jgi:hypothetical protein